MSSVLCVPSKAIDAWFAAAVLHNGHALLNGLECNLSLAARLAALPMGERVKKTTRDYRAREKQIATAWAVVREQCLQAERFSTEVEAVPLSHRLRTTLETP